MKNFAYFILLKNAWKYAEKHRYYIVVFYIMQVVSSLGLLMQPYCFGKLTNVLQIGGKNMFKDLLFWAAVYIGIYIAFWMIHALARLLERRVAVYIRKNLNDQLYCCLRELPLQWHQNHHSGDTINRLSKASSALQQFSQGQYVLIGLFTKFGGALILLLCVISPFTGIVTVGMGFLILSLIIYFDRILIPIYEKGNEFQHYFAAALHDYVTNISTIITLRLGDKTRHELLNRFDKMIPNEKSEIDINEAKWFSFDILLNIIVISLIIYYVWDQTYNHQQVIMVGSFVMVFQYFQHLMDAFVSFSQTYGGLVQQSIAVQAIDPILQDHAKLEVKQISKVDYGWKKIEISNINFSYEDREHHRHQLQNIALTIHRGQRIAIIGASGAGKSTLLSLLRGLYPVDKARVKVDDVTYDNLFALSHLSTLIPQEPEIFENTILYNVTVGIHRSDQDIQEALKIACFDTVMKNLPNGMQTDIREKGVNLSGGQKQRLALARGVFMAKESSLLLLDEPTSSVDSATETKIYENLFSAFPDVTIISSVHRLHLLHLFDWIYMFDDGKVIEQGTFQDLLQAKASFYKIWQQYLHTKTPDSEPINT